jgi:hypothetical protein
MIAVERRGRLGNQLFQFAFGIAASARLDTSFVMADDELRGLFTLDGYANVLGRLSRSLSYRAQRAAHPFPVVKIANTDFTTPAEVVARLEDRRHYAGFFQSEDFFRDVADRVRAAFTPRREHRERFEQRYTGLVGAPYVCCHIRRTDYLEWRGGAALPFSYYADALDVLGARDTPVVFVGDDLTNARRAFGDLPGVRFEQNDEVVDLQLLTHAESAVTSNSTFGWWGAWLGRPGRSIVTPQYFVGFREGREYPPGIIPSGWTQIDAGREDG